MGWFDKVREARTTLTGRESKETLDHMEDFFGNGKNWKQGVYSAANGARCLVGAADHVRVSKIDDAKYWLRQAIAEREPNWTIEQFNDNCDDYSEIVTVIRRAKELARQAQMPAVRHVTQRPAAPARLLPAPPVAEVRPPEPQHRQAPVPAPRPAPVAVNVRPPTPAPVRAPAPATATPRRRNLFWEILGE